MPIKPPIRAQVIGKLQEHEALLHMPALPGHIKDGIRASLEVVSQLKDITFRAPGLTEVRVKWDFTDPTILEFRFTWSFHDDMRAEQLGHTGQQLSVLPWIQRGMDPEYLPHILQRMVQVSLHHFTQVRREPAG